LLSGFLAISISISFECWVKYVRRVCGKEKWSKYRKLKVKGYSKVSVSHANHVTRTKFSHTILSLFFFYQDTKIEFEMLSVTSDSGGQEQRRPAERFFLSDV